MTNLTYDTYHKIVQDNSLINAYSYFEYLNENKNILKADFLKERLQSLLRTLTENQASVEDSSESDSKRGDENSSN